MILISFLVYAGDVSTLGGSVHTLKKSVQALVVAGEDSGP